MNNVLSITSKATEQIKKIMSNAPNGMDSVVIGVDKSGCSGYAYKLDFGKSSEFKNFEIIDQDGTKILIDPKATMFLLGSILTFNLPILAQQIALFFALPGILLYEFLLKRIPFIGNIVISIMVGLVFVFTSSGLDTNISHALRIMCLAFFLNLIREIIKDIQDFEGDTFINYKTLPIYFGKYPTIILVRFIFIIFFIISISINSASEKFFLAKCKNIALPFPFIIGSIL